PALDGRACSVALASGDVLVAGDGAAYLYRSATGAFDSLPGAPAFATGAIALWSGDALLCALRSCVVLDGATRSLGPQSVNGIEAEGAGLVALASGDAFAVSAGAGGATLRPYSFRYESLPAG